MWLKPLYSLSPNYRSISATNDRFCIPNLSICIRFNPLPSVLTDGKLHLQKGFSHIHHVEIENGDIPATNGLVHSTNDVIMGE